MINLARFPAWGVLRDFDRLFGEGLASDSDPVRWNPRVDVFDRDTALVIRAEVAGISSDDIDVAVEGRTLTITGTREFAEADEAEGAYHRKEVFEGPFKRTLVLPVGTDAEAITASSKHGIIEITVPKRADVLPRKVEIDVQR